MTIAFAVHAGTQTHYRTRCPGMMHTNNFFTRHKARLKTPQKQSKLFTVIRRIWPFISRTNKKQVATIYLHQGQIKIDHERNKMTAQILLTPPDFYTISGRSEQSRDKLTWSEKSRVYFPSIYMINIYKWQHLIPQKIHYLIEHTAHSTMAQNGGSTG